jgi:hypothetical protein
MRSSLEDDLRRIGPSQLRVPQAERVIDGLQDSGQCRRGFGLVARSLEVDPQGAPAARSVEVPLEPHQRRGLASLPAGMQREVLALLDQLLDELQAPLGREHIVLARYARAGGVERERQATKPNAGLLTPQGSACRQDCVAQAKLCEHPLFDDVE